MTFEMDEGGIYRLVAAPSSSRAKVCMYTDSYDGTWFPPQGGGPAILDLYGLTDSQVDILLTIISEEHPSFRLCGNLVMFDSTLIDSIVLVPT